MSQTNKNRQWLRYFRLVVAVDKDNQQAIDLSEFRCKFRISQAVIGKPCTAEITVYNVSQETVNRLGIGTNVIENQGMRVIIEAIRTTTASFSKAICGGNPSAARAKLKPSCAW